MLVNMLVEFMIENYGDIFQEEVAGPSAKESSAPMERSTGKGLMVVVDCG